MGVDDVPTYLAFLLADIFPAAAPVVLLWEAVGGATLAESALPDSTAEAFISLACLGEGGERGERREVN